VVTVSGVGGIATGAALTLGASGVVTVNGVGGIATGAALVAGTSGAIEINGLGGIAAGKALAESANGTITISGVGGLASAEPIAMGASGTITISGTGGIAEGAAEAEGATGTIAILGTGGIATGDPIAAEAEGASGVIIIDGTGGEVRLGDERSFALDPRTYPNVRFRGLKNFKDETLQVEIPPPTMVEPDPQPEPVVTAKGDSGAIARILSARAPLPPVVLPAQHERTLKALADLPRLKIYAPGAQDSARRQRRDTTAEDAGNITQLLARIDTLVAENARLKSIESAMRGAHAAQLMELRANHRQAMEDQAAQHLEDLMQIDKEMQRQRNESHARALVQQLMEQN
jgi:hypothetical protein